MQGDSFALLCLYLPAVPLTATKSAKKVKRQLGVVSFTLASISSCLAEGNLF